MALPKPGGYTIGLTRSQVGKVSIFGCHFILIINVHFQARCAAVTLHQYLERKRLNYFETINDEELDEIPTVLLINQP